MSDSDVESGEYKQNNNHDGPSPNQVGRSRSKSPRGEAPGRSPTPRKRSYTRSRSRGTPRSRSPSYARSRSRSQHRYSRDRDRRSYGRRSRSYERRYARRSYSRSRSRSRGSRSPLSGRKRHIGDRMNPPSGKCLGVFGLSLYTSEKDLEEVFRRYGRIDKSNIVIDQKTGRSRGFGFVYYHETEDAVEAKERANGMDLDGRKIRVDFSITKRAHTPTPGMYVGRPAPHYNVQSRNRYDDRSYGRERSDRDRYDYRDRYDSYRDDYRDRDRYRRSPSPYYRRRSPSPYGRDRRY